MEKKLIEKEIQEAEAWVNKGVTDVPGMTFEQGVLYALTWVMGEGEKPIENPFEDS